MSEIRVVAVEEDGQNVRIDKLLASNMPDLSRSRIRELIDDGLVTLSGKAVKASLKMQAGQEIRVEIPDLEEADIVPQAMDLSILYEDEDVLIVDKPKGLTVHPAPGHADGTLVNGILAHCGDHLSGINGVARPGIVHRIDKDTSGALIICKNDAAHRKVAEQLKDHTITRRYRGIVHGNLKDDTGTVRGNIGRSPSNRKKMAVVKEGGKPAVTHYRVLERFRGYTSCEFVLETGRTHQIRVHMASIGHPLVGDPLYGPPKCPFPTEGQALHAMVIGFVHPSTGKYIECTAPLPAYYTELLETLRRR